MLLPVLPTAPPHTDLATPPRPWRRPGPLSLTRLAPPIWSPHALSPLPPGWAATTSHLNPCNRLASSQSPHSSRSEFGKPTAHQLRACLLSVLPSVVFLAVYRPPGGGPDGPQHLQPHWPFPLPFSLPMATTRPSHSPSSARDGLLTHLTAVLCFMQGSTQIPGQQPLGVTL